MAESQRLRCHGRVQAVWRVVVDSCQGRVQHYLAAKQGGTFESGMWSGPRVPHHSSRDDRHTATAAGVGHISTEVSALRTRKETEQALASTAQAYCRRSFVRRDESCVMMAMETPMPGHIACARTAQYMVPFASYRLSMPGRRMARWGCVAD